MAENSNSDKNFIPIVVATVTISVIYICFFISVPTILFNYDTDFSTLDLDKQLSAINDLRNSGLGIVTAIVISLALYFTYRRNQHLSVQLEVQQAQLKSLQDGQVSDKFIRAVELIDLKNPTEVQIAGLISLQSLAIENDHLFNEIINIFVSFLNNRSINIHELDTNKPYKSTERVTNSPEVNEALERLIHLTKVKKYSTTIALRDIKIDKFEYNISSNRRCIWSFVNCYIEDLTLNGNDQEFESAEPLKLIPYSFIIENCIIDFALFYKLHDAKIDVNYTLIKDLYIIKPVNTLTISRCIIQGLIVSTKNDEQQEFRISNTVVRLVLFSQAIKENVSLEQLLPLNEEKLSNSILDENYNIIQKTDSFLRIYTFQDSKKSPKFIDAQKNESLKKFGF